MPSFLGLVPVQVRSAHLLQNGGYESYVLDARSLVRDSPAAPGAVRVGSPWLPVYLGSVEVGEVLTRIR